MGARAPARGSSKDRAVSTDPAQRTLLHRSSGQWHRRSSRYLDSSVLVAGRERGGDWKAFPAVSCALVLKQMLSKSFCIFIQMPLTTVRFICWAGCTLSCGLLDRNTGSCLAPPRVPLLPVMGSLQGPGPLAQSVVLLQGSAAHLLPPAAFVQQEHRLTTGSVPLQRPGWRACLQSSHSCHGTSLRDAGEAEGAGCVSDVGQAAGAQLQ